MQDKELIEYVRIDYPFDDIDEESVKKALASLEMRGYLKDNRVI